MSGILEGIRVVDFTLYMAGPLAGAMLGDMGADVIHVEQRQGGDPFRAMQSFMGTNMLLPNGKEVLFEEVNRNKKSIALDIKKPEGLAIMRRLVGVSDIFITNYRPNARQRLGMDYQSLKKLNPKLIYGSVSTFGDEGPLKDSPGFDLAGMAASGGMLAAGDVGMEPIHLAPGMADRIASFNLAYGLLGAIVARERFGVGQEVKTSQIGAMTAMQCSSLINYLRNGEEIARHNRKEERNPLYNWYRCADDAWIALADVRPHVWPTFCRALGVSGLELDPRFVDQQQRAKNCVELIRIIDAEMTKLTRAEWLRRFKEAGDIVVCKVSSISDLASDEQMLANRYIIDYRHPSDGPMKVIGFPVHWTETPAQMHLPPPVLGEHTESILTDLLQYSWDEIAALKEKQVIL